MKKILFLWLSMLFLASMSFAQTTKKRVDSTQVVPLDTATSFLVLNSNGATRRLAKSAIQGQIDNINGILPLKANAANVDTAKANIRAEMSSNINYVQTYSEATYQKITGFKTSNNVAYVSKKYSVAGDADWILQKNTAQVGNPIAPFPNPQLAMQAITAKLVNREIEKGVIIVLEGNVYNVAENLDTAGLTGLDYVYRTTSGHYFHPFPSTTTRADDDSLCLSLTFPNLDMVFQKGSGITHVVGRGLLIAVHDTIAPQRVNGFGSFNHTVTNNRSGSIGNINITSGNTKGEFEFSGDTLKAARIDPSVHGWAVIGAQSSSRMLYNFKYVETFENNSLFRMGGAGNVIIDKLVTDTVGLPYMYLGSPYSPWGLFTVWGGLYPNVKINETYTASNPVFVWGYGEQNSNYTLEINKATQKYRTQYQTNFIGTNANAKPQGVGVAGTLSGLCNYSTGSNRPYGNSQITVKVNSYRGEAPALIMSGNGVIKTCNIKFEFGKIWQDSVQNGSVTSKSPIYVSLSGSVDSSLIQIYANVLTKSAPAISIENNSKVSISGVFKTYSAVKSIIDITGSNTNTILSANLITQGTQASIDGISGSTVTCLPTSTSNTAVSSNVTVTGMLNINSAFKQ